MITLVYSGSGILFPTHLGWTQFMYEFLPKEALKNINFVGTSGGSIVASVMATGMPPREMKDIAKTLLPKKMISFNWHFWQPARHMGLLELDKMEKELRKYLPKTFFDYKQHSAVIVTTDLEAKDTFYCSKKKTPGTDVARVVRASCSVPFLFTPVEFGSRLLTDGGTTNNYAVDYFGDGKDTYGCRLMSCPETIQTKKYIEDKMDEDNVAYKKKHKIKRRLDFILSVFECMMGASLKEHLEDAIYAKTTNVKVPYETFDFGIKEEDVDIMFAAGYQDAMTAFTKRGK